MPVYTTPGVYVEEVAGAPPIAGVGTSTAAFIGKVADEVEMPPKPQRPGEDEERYEVAEIGKFEVVSNFEQFKTRFGAPQEDNKILAHAVYGFFLNGGVLAYIARVANLADANAVKDALKELEKIDEVAILAAPGALSTEVQTLLISHCKTMTDRFAILDGQRTTDITVEAIKGDVGDDNYAGLYFPWIQVLNQTEGDDVPKRLTVPPSGHMAGIYARVDQLRGVHKAPANEKVRGALDLDYRVTHGEQGILNPKGINIIRSFNGNIKVWGARTLGGDANGEFKYINVRRLFLFIRESIDEGTQFAVFEPNADPLWEKIKRSVSGFLTTVWRDGALFGATPDEAFFVKCDETTNPKEVRDLGQVITEIGLAVVKPAEFVIFRISQINGVES